MTRAEIEAVKQAILDLKSGHEWSFYMGTALRDCPGVVLRVAVLDALIAKRP